MKIPSLGSRGGGWVILQLLALGAIGVTGLLAPGWAQELRAVRSIIGLVVAAAGGLLGLAGVRDLGSSLTARPRPAEGAELREHGVYARARHPLYGALLLLGLGWLLLTSPWVVVPWFALLLILLAKSTREEAWLLDRYEGYAAYRARVWRRFVPYLV